MGLPEASQCCSNFTRLPGDLLCNESAFCGERTDVLAREVLKHRQGYEKLLKKLIQLILLFEAQDNHQIELFFQDGKWPLVNIDGDTCLSCLCQEMLSVVCTVLPEDPYEYMMNHVAQGTIIMSANLSKQDNAHEAC